MAAQESSQPLQVRDVEDSNFAEHGCSIPLLVALFLFVALFVVVCLYLRWACRRYNPDVAAAPASPSSAVDATSASKGSGLDAAAITGLPVTIYQPSPRAAGEEAQCSICISALVEREKVKTLPPCGHCFHPECVDAWLQSRPSCPLCRCSLLLAASQPDVGSEAMV